MIVLHIWKKKSCRGSESMQGLTEILSMPCAAWVRVWAFVECMTFWTIFVSDIRPKALCFFSFWRYFFFVLLHVSLRQLDVWRMKCGVWSLSEKCEVWSVKFGVGSKQWEVWSVKWEVWSVDCAVWSEKCEVWSLECEVWSGKEAVRSEKCEVWTVKCGVWSAK